MSKGVLLEDWQKARDKDVEGRSALKRRPKPLTENHVRYQRAIQDNRVIICVGNAGTGKTTLACGVAASLLRDGKVEQIVLARPLVECDEELGTLPGGIEEKTELFIAPLLAGLSESMTSEEFNKARRDGRITVVPLAQMRGRTFHNAVVIIDEAENATLRQLRMALTRIGENCKMVVNGDTTQSDLKGRCPLVDVWNRLAAKPRRSDIAFVEMGPEDCLRPDIVQFIDERLVAGEARSCTAKPTPQSYGDTTATAAHPKRSSSRYSKRLGS